MDTYYKWNGTDTTWYEITDSSWIPLVSSLVTKTDDTNNSPAYSSNNSYSILEFPLSFGYKWNKQRFVFLLKGGVVSGIIIKTKGNVYSGNEWTSIYNEMLNNFQLSVSGAINIGYKINNSILLSGEINYRKHFISIFNEDLQLSGKPEFIGLKVGMKYCFN